MRDDRLAEALKGIQLSDAQRTKVDAVRSKYRDSLTALRSRSGSDASQDRRQQFRDPMRRQFEDVRGVLTAPAAGLQQQRRGDTSPPWPARRVEQVVI